MREIKFRAWDVERKAMFFPSSVSWANGFMWAANVFGDNRYESVIEKSELMQFTGLLDKNGKEIYEGDIVRYGCVGGGVEQAPVVWRDYASFGMPHMDFGACRTDEGWEVIGNIYETPELLEKKS